MKNEKVPLHWALWKIGEEVLYMKKIISFVGTYTIVSFALIGVKFCIERVRSNV